MAERVFLIMSSEEAHAVEYALVQRIARLGTVPFTCPVLQKMRIDERDVLRRALDNLKAPL